MMLVTSVIISFCLCFAYNTELYETEGQGIGFRSGVSDVHSRCGFVFGAGRCPK